MNASRFPLLPFSWLYGAAVTIRNKCFDWGVFTSRDLGAPTISVGNLSVGGTGKTPLVAYIARYFQTKGKRVAILSRGYKRESSGYILVSDGRQVFVGAQDSGDEPQELARGLRGVIVAVDEKRRRAGQKVLERYAVDVFVLDDGFQHRGVKRDLDIVTIPASLDEAPYWGIELRPLLIPAGRLREPLRSLRRANHLVFTRARAVGPTIDAVEVLRDGYRHCSSADVSAVDFQVRGFVRLSDAVKEDPDEWRGKRVYLFSGIAGPEQFARLVADLGVVIVGRSDYPDHFEYHVQDIKRLENRFKSSEAEFLLTTMKDAARLSGSNEGRAFMNEFPVYGFAIDIDFVFGKETFHQHLDRLFA